MLCRFAPKLPLSETDICLTKAKKKRAVLLELLMPDLLAKDPLVSAPLIAHVTKTPL